jgi:SNF5 / SMARCB1 / INI1
VYLRDQFEWPLFTTSSVTPENFAYVMSAELGIGGEFVPVVRFAGLGLMLKFMAL